MGIYLPNIEIPKDTLLIAIGPDGTVDVHRNDELTWFTLKDKAVFVPEHGRLIDADALDADLTQLDMRTGEDDAIGFSIYEIDNATTIIPAEGD